MHAFSLFPELWIFAWSLGNKLMRGKSTNLSPFFSPQVANGPERVSNFASFKDPQTPGNFNQHLIKQVFTEVPPGLRVQ
jgi:hypothetical protein